MQHAPLNSIEIFTLFHVLGGFHDLSSPNGNLQNVKHGALYFYTRIYQCLLFMSHVQLLMS